MKRVILFTFMIFIIPSLVFAFEQPAWQRSFFGQKKAPVVRTQQVTGSITISKPLKKSALKGFIEGEFNGIKFQVKASLINSIVCIKEPVVWEKLPKQLVSYEEDPIGWELEVINQIKTRRAALKKENPKQWEMERVWRERARKNGGKVEEIITLISIPPLRIWGKDRASIRISESVMSYEQVIKLIQPSKSWW